MVTAMGCPHDTPTADDLLDVVAEWIENELIGTLEGRLQFHARVAANIVAMVAREIRLGPEQQQAHRQRLEELGCTDDADLAARIRSGALDERLAEVRAAVERSVHDKLEVANPRYFAEERTDG